MVAAGTEVEGNLRRHLLPWLTPRRQLLLHPLRNIQGLVTLAGPSNKDRVVTGPGNMALAAAKQDSLGMGPVVEG